MWKYNAVIQFLVVDDRYERCSAESESYIAAVHGNYISQFYCNIRVKGRSFPIFIQVNCSVNADAKFEFNRMFELTDLRALEPSSVVEGFKRMLDDYARELSRIYELAKTCK